jgi:acyl-CoA thioester hydrolase
MGENATNHSESFELTILVEPADIDQLGHVNNVIYLRWVQDVAVAHWTAAAAEEDQKRLFWVVLRHEIDYRQAALAGEKLVVRTWVGDATRLKFERHTEFVRATDGAVVARARTIWCPVDRVTGKPTPVGEQVRARFSSRRATAG